MRNWGLQQFVPARHRVSSRVVALGVVCVVAAAGIVPAQAQEFRKFKLQDVGGYLEVGFWAEYERRSREDVASSFETKELELYERLRLDLDGYFFHPTIVAFRLSPELEFIQRRTKVLDEENSSKNRLVGGELRLAVLDGHYYGLSLHAARQEVDVDAVFQPAGKILRDTFGTTFRFQKGPIPFDIAYTRTAFQGSGSAADTNEVTDELAVRGQYSAGSRSKGTLEYRLTDIRQETFGRDVTTQWFRVGNTTTLGALKRLRLNGNLRYRQQTGSVNSTTKAFQESLSWRHTENLSSYHSLSFNRFEVGDDPVEIWDARSAFSHDLWGSLSSQVQLNAGLDESSSSKTRKYGSSISENYSRALGNWGRIALGLRTYADVVERQPTQEVDVVNDEAVTFVDLFPVRLRHFDIDPLSIRVTDERGVIVYAPIQDYLITTREPITEIQRVPGGRILDGETVLVSYSYTTGVAGTALSTGARATLRLSYRDASSIYGEYARGRQSMLSGSTDSRLQQLDAWVVGVKGEWRWFSGKVEFEDHESTFSPNRSLTKQASISFSPMPRVLARLSVNHQNVRYMETDEEINTLNIYGNATVDITRRSQFWIDANYRRQRSKGSATLDNMDAYEVKTSYVWRLSLLTAEVSANFYNVDQRGQREEAQEFKITLRREF